MVLLLYSEEYTPHSFDAYDLILTYLSFLLFFMEATQFEQVWQEKDLVVLILDLKNEVGSIFGYNDVCEVNHSWLL